METPRCDVIGCTADAQWFLITEHNGDNHEQRLCHRHWRQRMAGRSQRVVRWGHVSSPASGASASGEPSRADAAESSTGPVADGSTGSSDAPHQPPAGGPAR